MDDCSPRSERANALNVRLRGAIRRRYNYVSPLMGALDKSLLLLPSQESGPPTDRLYFVWEDRWSAETRFLRPDEPANPGRRAPPEQFVRRWERIPPSHRHPTFSIVNIAVQTQFHVTGATLFHHFPGLEPDRFPIENTRFPRYTRLCYRGVTMWSKVSNKERGGS